MRSFVRGALEIARGYVRIARLLPAGGRGLVGALVGLNLDPGAAARWSSSWPRAS